MGTYSHYIGIGRSEVECVISYNVEPGFAGDRIDPPYDASAEIQSIKIFVGKQVHDCPKWLSDLLEADEGLHNDLLLNEEDCPDRARDQRIDDALTHQRAA